MFQMMRATFLRIAACLACLLFPTPRSSFGGEASGADDVHFVRRFTVEKDELIMCVCFSPDGRSVIAGTTFGNIWVWDAGNEKSVRKIKGASDELLAGGVQCIACSPDGKRLLAGCGNGDVQLADLNSNRIIRTLKGHTWAVSGVAFTKDGRRGLSGSPAADSKEFNPYRYPIFLWDLEEGKELYRIAAESRPTCLEVSPDQKTFLSVEGMINLRDLSTGKVIRSFEGGRFRVVGAHFRADGGEIISSCMDEPVRLWDVKTGKCKNFLKLEDYIAESMAVSPNGRLVLLGAVKQARLWELPSGKELYRWDKLDGEVAVAFSPDGCFGLIADRWGSVQLWQLRKPAQKKEQ